MATMNLLSVYLSGASLILLLTTVSDANDYDDFTPAPDYDMDYNATFEYSLFSNASSEDLDRLSERFIDAEDDDVITEEPTVTVTVATARPTTAQHQEKEGGATRRPAPPTPKGSASLPLSMDLWTLMILIGLNTQQLLHTL